MTGTRTALDDVVRRYGRHALGDPVALRSALRGLGDPLTAAETTRLCAAARERTGVEDLLHTLEDTGPPKRRRLRWAAAAAVVVVVAAAGVFFAVRGGGDPAPPPDRGAPEQIALRYRALGAKLLDGVSGCAPVRAQPGEVERLSCAAGTFSVVLVTYDAVSRLTARRAEAAAVADVARTARKSVAGASFAMAEQRSGLSTVYWDVESPRPLSATVTAPGTGLPALTAFYDQRQFGGLRRPDVPGPAFTSGVLWEFAQPQVVNEPSAKCTSVPVTTDVTESVKCPLADGGMLVFDRATDRDALLKTRTEFAGEGGTVPGSTRVLAWNRLGGGPPTGQLIEFVTADDRSPTLYFDDDTTRAYGIFFGPPGSSLDALEERWRVGRR